MLFVSFVYHLYTVYLVFVFFNVLSCCLFLLFWGLEVLLLGLILIPRVAILVAVRGLELGCSIWTQLTSQKHSFGTPDVYVRFVLTLCVFLGEKLS